MTIANPQLDSDQPHTMSHDDESILICAVPYCIGRQSYIVWSCDRWLRDRWARLYADTRAVILKDIQAALEQERLGHRTLGMEMDRDTWVALYRDMNPGGILEAVTRRPRGAISARTTR